MFSYLTGFLNGSSAIQVSGSSLLTGSAMALTSPAYGQHQAGGAWYKTRQDVTSFTTDFTFQVDPTAFGFTFCVQNSNSTTNPSRYGGTWSGDYASADANGLGYGAYSFQPGVALGNSVAIKFDMTALNGQAYVGTTPSGVGLYINGGPTMEGGFSPENDLSALGIKLQSGDVMRAHVVYDGALLTLVLTDTHTGTQARLSWPVNIPAAIGSSTAWVGFTGGTVPPVNQNILTWSFNEGYAQELPSPSFSVAGGSYTSAQSVSLSSYPGTAIYYTTNGQQPTTASNLYAGPITVSSNEVVQAIAVEPGYTDSHVAVANYQIAPAGTPIINFASGFANASNLIVTNGTAVLNGTAIQLTDTNHNLETGSAWYAVPVNVQSFTTSFTLQLLSPSANGMTFTIQNQPPSSSDNSIRYVSGGPYALAASQSGLGYAGILSSVAVKFDLYTGSGDTTGLYTNGAQPTTPDIDLSSSGLSLHSGNPLAVTLAYNGTTLTMTITDTKTHASSSNSWAINIPATVGANTAYVGFTGATGGLEALQEVSTWTYTH